MASLLAAVPAGRDLGWRGRRNWARQSPAGGPLGPLPASGQKRNRVSPPGSADRTATAELGSIR
jgi:hypothetical protein